MEKSEEERIARSLRKSLADLAADVKALRETVECLNTTIRLEVERKIN